MYFPIQCAPHVHNNTTIQKDARQKLIMICCVRICLNKRKSFLPEFFQNIFCWAKQRFWRGAVSLVSRIHLFFFFHFHFLPDFQNIFWVPKQRFRRGAVSLVSRIHFFHFSLSLSTRFLKYFLSGEAKVLEGCSVFGVQNPLFSFFTFTFYQIFEIIFVGRSKGFGGLQCLWCPESILFIFQFHFLPDL